ncbi:helix-turn-helix domain-containing protein [Shimia sediminis]|uniref:helix-turn-helix domain-containing protein n=1 Tax=Shimia sediminis TaxID=2497945 RepID=UPI000F8F76B5|nr:helix-turn-helix transcriptional regulator [Shimia sediminis]
MSPEQCKAARAMLNLSQGQLAKLSGVAESTIIPFEKSQRRPHNSTLDRLRIALENAGVEFIPANGGGAGVRLTSGKRQ